MKNNVVNKRGRKTLKEKSQKLLIGGYETRDRIETQTWEASDISIHRHHSVTLPLPTQLFFPYTIFILFSLWRLSPWDFILFP